MKSIMTLLLALMALRPSSLQTAVPVEQEPRHRTKFENQYVRVLDVHFPPGYTTLFHTHANDNIAVVIAGGKRRVERVGEQPIDGRSDTGNAGFSKATYTHRITNIDDAILRFIDVELLSSPVGSKSAIPHDKVAGHKIILENERVRISRLKLEPNQSTDLFTCEIPGLTVVVLPAKVQIKTPKQKARTEDFKPGDFRWHTNSFSRSLKNIGSTNFEAIEIELK